MSFEIAALPLFSFIALLVVTGALLYGWQGWLALKTRELEQGTARPALEPEDKGVAPAAARIEIADLKERIRRLEAIASGVDL
ncbi:hypothetical protein [Croceicoccus mobilis]|uniref:Uncharacterized protein n=1 Tax=Croceicoccus mobilis TaxID=1703339 RepID=A0A916Z065_9SPHN|nr:hypothetical protein [Croceicoccus mobilis]GGD69586.1 hypothetical protein GCM10010990_18870 [Croceicoccus mobilis]